MARPWHATLGTYRRIAMLGLLFAVELVALSLWLDGASLNRHNPVTNWMHDWGAAILRSVVAFAALFLALAYARAKATFAAISAASLETPIGGRYLAAHAAALGVLGLLAPSLYGGTARGIAADAIGIAWIACGLAAILSAAVAFIAWPLWIKTLRATGNIWAYALLAGVAAGCFGSVVRALWEPAGHVTFEIVRVMLRPLLPGMLLDPATMLIGTARFNVTIEPACSGMEGMGLVLVFAAVWLWLFRGELRFPQALLVVPVGLAAAFLLNSVRIAALILIGNAGAPGIAMGGFHSQAGWIAFNVVAIALTLGAQKVPGVAVARAPVPVPAARTHEDHTDAYLLPFLAILAAGMISRAASAQFEWLYPLRFFAAAAVLWWNRRTYRSLDWRCGWLGPTVGAAVFALWIVIDRMATANTAGGTVAGLVAGHGVGWTVWLVLRTLGAVVTVPIAEELAFRGYVMRRVSSAEFERVDFGSVTLAGLAVSSVAFGLMHGARWMAGTAAGLAYGLAVRRRGRIGESVAAHAVTNALLAAWVITRGEWRLW